MSKEEPKLLAVSIYKNKYNSLPVLITIHSSYYCCTPQSEGHLYQVNLYQLSSVNYNLKIKEITKILGQDAHGFDGRIEGKVTYKFKDIASIKTWLDLNYNKLPASLSKKADFRRLHS